MSKEESLTKFYYEFVNKVSINEDISKKFFEELVISMLLGHENINKKLTAEFDYERILLFSMLYNSCKREEQINVEEVLKLFFEIDREYYNELLKGCTLDNEISFLKFCFSVSVKANAENDLENRMYSLMEPYKELINVYKEFTKLSDIYRTGWKMRNIDTKYGESDSAHTLQMVALASAYFRIYKPANLDLKKVMEMIIIHEIGEILAGDIAEVDKNHDNKFELEYKGVVNTFKDLKNNEYFINLWLEFEKRESEEAKFVYYIDKLDAVLKSKYFDELLNRDDLFEEFYSYEEKRGIFNNTEFQRLFYSLKDK